MRGLRDVRRQRLLYTVRGALQRPANRQSVHPGSSDLVHQWLADDAGERLLHLQPVQQHAGAEAGRALGVLELVLGCVTYRRDVEVSPRQATDEVLEKQGGRDRTGRAPGV